MKRRVLSAFMALALCLTLLPAPALAAEADAPEGGSPAVSEQAGTNEDENGAEGGPRNTGTPDAGSTEESKADAPEGGEDENAGNNADAAVFAVQTMIDALPIVSELDGMTADELDTAYDDIQAAYDAYEALNAEQQAQITGADFETLFGWFNSQTALLADAQSGVHTHCVCGGNGDVNGHEHDSAVTAWNAADSLPNSAGSYYLTQSVSGGWTVPEGEVNLCLNGQTIDGSIKVGSGATLTLTDCSSDNSGKIQGGVTVNGGKFELYSGTITGGVQVGIKGGTYQTGSSFTMYGGAITGNEVSSSSGGGVFLVGTTNHADPPSFTMHGGTISNNTAGASDGGGGGVYVGEKCSFTMDGGTITGNTATNGNGGGIYIHFNAGSVSISNATITGNKAPATGNVSYGHGGGIYSERGVTVKNVTITGNNSTFAGGGIYGKGAITLTDATVTDNSQYDVYYDGKESNTPELTVSGSVKAGYYANNDWKLPIHVSGALSENSVIRVGVYEGIKPGYGSKVTLAESANGVKLRAENFEADAADYVTSLGDDGNVYLVPCTHEMDDTGYTCKKCKTQFDARVGDSAYYKTLTDAFNAARGSTVTLLRNVTLTGNCSSENYSATLDLNGKTVSTENKYIRVGGGNKSNTLTVKDSSKGGGTQALNVKFSVGSNGTLAVDNSYTGEISRVELQAGGALERFGCKIGELVLSNAAYGSTSTGYGLKLWNGNTNACTIGKFTDNNKSKSLTVKDLLGTDYAKCELYGENSGTWSVVDKSTKIAELTGYTAYKVQFPECVHQCANDSNPVCSVCHKNLYTKITAKAADGTAKTAYFTEDSALENGYVEAIQTLNGWSNEGCTEPTLTLLRDMYAFGTSMPLTGTLTLEGGTHTARNVTVAENANVTFASGSYKGATINGTATVETGVTFTDASVTVNGTLNAKGGIFDGRVEFNGSSTANISGGSFNSEKKYGGVTFDYNVTGTISGGTFVFADFYTTKVKLSGGTFTIIKTNGDRKLADLLAEGAAYYGASDNQAVTNDGVNTLENVKVVSHTHNGGQNGNGTCSICGKKMTASLTVGGKTSWYVAFATAIEAANAADGEKTITLYQDVNGYADGHSTTYELTRGPVTLATGGKTVTRANLTAKDISLTVTGSNGGFNVTVDGKGAELTVNDGNTELGIVTAQNGGKLSLSNGTFSRVAVKDDGSSASLSGGSYGEITSGNGYVKPYALLAKGYAYKRTRDSKWLPNANSISEEVTVEKAPFVVEKIYPNNNKDYTGSSAFATDGNITLTAVIAPETEGDTYYYWWELFNESENDWTTSFNKVNTATHTGGQSKTLTISGLPVDKSYQYHIFVQCSNGYNCYSEPFTVTRHQHSWTYTASGATITAKCTAEGCYLTDGNGGSVTINKPAHTTYGDGQSEKATLTETSWQGLAVNENAITYTKDGTSLGAAPTNAGTYTASITVGEGNKAVTASVKYSIEKATPTAENFSFTAPTDLTYNGEVKIAAIAPNTDITGMGTVTVKYNRDGREVQNPTNAGTYTVKIAVTEGTNYAVTSELTAEGWKFTIARNTTEPTVTLSGDTTYTGGQIKPTVTVKVGETTLVENRDYTVTYGENKNAGENAGFVTVTAKGNYNFAGKTVKFTIAPKTLTAADLTYSGVITKVYDGSNSAPDDLSVFVKPSSLAGTDTLAVTGTLKYNSANVNEANQITFTPAAIATGNYALAASQVLTITGAKITQATPTYTVPTGLTAKYGQTLVDVNIAAATGWSWMNTGTAVGTPATKNFPAKFTPTDAINYKTVENIDVSVAVGKADAPTLTNITVSQKYTVTTEQSKNIGTVGMPADAGTLTYTAGTATQTGSVTVTGWNVDSTGKVTYTLSGGAAGDTVTLPVTITSTNYADATVKVVITLTAKDDQAALTLTGGTTVVYGQTLQLGTTGGSGSGAVTYRIDTAHSTGEAAIDPNTGVLTPVKVGSVSVIATKTGDNDYNAVTSSPVEITITRATPTGEPAYTKITASGKTLADAALGIGTITPAGGTIAWDDPTTTEVVANKSYGWTYTPTDTNYTTLAGSIQLWHKSTSSGGGSYYAPTVPDMPMLYRGCTGDAVKTLQDKLNTLGYNSGNVDGIFGAKTYAAVTAFQKANGLGVDGIVGKLTWGKLYGVSPAMPVETTTVVGRPMVSYGSRGDAVRKLQELLNAKGYTCGNVDGIFGSKTKAAVLAFQKANGLAADGIVGPLTWGKLV